MKQTFKNIIFSGLVLLALLVLAEGFQRVRLAVSYSPKKWLLYGLSWNSVPAESPRVLIYPVREKGKYHLLQTGKRKISGETDQISIKVNQLGFRGNNILRQKSEGVYRIVAIGGSSTFGAMNPDHETYPAILQRELNRRLGSERFEVINAGIPGLAPSHLIHLIRPEILPLEPDLILIMSMFNHYFVVSNEGWRRPLIHLRKLLEQRSVLFLTLSEKFTYFSDERSILAKLFVLFADYRSYLEDIIEQSKSKGARVFVVMQPILPRGKSGKNLIPGSTASEQGWEPRFYKKVLRLVDTVARLKQVVVVDASVATGGFSLDMFQDAVHLTSEGNAFVAQKIIESMKQEKIIPE